MANNDNKDTEDIKLLLKLSEEFCDEAISSVYKNKPLSPNAAYRLGKLYSTITRLKEKFQS